jgi:predicted nucleic acid-binding protein
MTLTIVVDSSSIISLSSNCLLCILERFKNEFDVRFVVGEKVLHETVVRAIQSKKFRLEGFRLLECIKKGVIEVVANDETKRLTDEIIRVSNNCFKAKGNAINIIHWGESEMLSIAKHLNAGLVLVDERTTRLLVESPENLREQQERKLHTKVEIVHDQLEKFKSLVGNLRVARSTELCALAFENGFFNEYEQEQVLNLEDKRMKILSGLLWGLKLNGCAITVQEIDSYINLIK